MSGNRAQRAGESDSRYILRMRRLHTARQRPRSPVFERPDEPPPPPDDGPVGANFTFCTSVTVLYGNFGRFG
eukprot:COSAG05_NODE_1146_length_5731_cov_2.187322_5_plen_71_part_01